MPDLRDQLADSLGPAFTIERELTGGGMSQVFVVRDNTLGREVVVKVLSPERAEGLSAERFTREIKVVAALQEPHIVPVLTSGTTGEHLPWYSMPYVRGESLRVRLKAGLMPVAEAVGVMRDVALALACAHRHGVVHRDIKPENVLLSEGTAVVTDFGIAKALTASRTIETGTATHDDTITQVGTSLGTPAYMAPEQAAGDPTTDHRADIYAFGVMAYEMLSGRHPFAGRMTPQQLLAAHMSETPLPLAKQRAGIPAAVTSVVMQCLAKDPALRPQSAESILGSLRTDDGRSNRRGSVPLFAGIVGVLALLALIGGLAIRARQHEGDRTPTLPTGAITSIAVIPFANTGGNARDEYFSDGMTDELAHALSRLAGVHVAGRSSSFAFKGKAVPAQEIGKTLDVAALIEGSVRRSGDRIRITAQLTKVADGKVIWSDSYESSGGDVFKVQDEVTRAIVVALAPTLRGDVVTSVADGGRGTADPEAYDLFLKGHYFWQQRGASNLARAIEYFHGAIARDSQFARAHAGLALAYGTLPFYGFDNADSVTELGLSSAHRAIALDSTLGDAQLAMGFLLNERIDLARSDTFFRRAIAIQPNDPYTRQLYAVHLDALGDISQSLAEKRRAKALDPLSPLLATNLAIGFIYARQFSDGIATNRRAQELDSTFTRGYFNSARLLLYSGVPDSAVLALMTATRMGPPIRGSLGMLVLAYAAAGRWNDAELAYARLRAFGGMKVSATDVAVAELALGHTQSSMDAFVIALARHELLYAFSSPGCDPIFDALRSPRFHEVMQRYGMKECPATKPWTIAPRVQ